MSLSFDSDDDSNALPSQRTYSEKTSQRQSEWADVERLKDLAEKVSAGTKVKDREDCMRKIADLLPRINQILTTADWASLLRKLMRGLREERDDFVAKLKNDSKSSSSQRKKFKSSASLPLQATQTQLAALSKQRDRLTVLASGFFKVLQMSLAEDIKDLPEEVQDDQDAELVENFSANQIYRLKGVLTDLYSHIYNTVILDSSYPCPLIKPLALHYLRSLDVCLLSRTAYRQLLTSKQWSLYMQLCVAMLQWNEDQDEVDDIDNFKDHNLDYCGRSKELNLTEHHLLVRILCRLAFALPHAAEDFRERLTELLVLFENLLSRLSEEIQLHQTILTALHFTVTEVSLEHVGIIKDFSGRILPHLVKLLQHCRRAETRYLVIQQLRFYLQTAYSYAENIHESPAMLKALIAMGESILSKGRLSIYSIPDPTTLALVFTDISNGQRSLGETVLALGSTDVSFLQKWNCLMLATDAFQALISAEGKKITDDMFVERVEKNMHNHRAQTSVILDLLKSIPSNELISAVLSVLILNGHSGILNDERLTGIFHSLQSTIKQPPSTAVASAYICFGLLIAREHDISRKLCDIPDMARFASTQLNSAIVSDSVMFLLLQCVKAPNLLSLDELRSIFSDLLRSFGGSDQPQSPVSCALLIEIYKRKGLQLDNKAVAAQLFSAVYRSVSLSPKTGQSVSNITSMLRLLMGKPDRSKSNLIVPTASFISSSRIWEQKMIDYAPHWQLIYGRRSTLLNELFSMNTFKTLSPSESPSSLPLSLVILVEFMAEFVQPFLRLIRKPVDDRGARIEELVLRFERDCALLAVITGMMDILKEASEIMTSTQYQSSFQELPEAIDSVVKEILTRLRKVVRHKKHFHRCIIALQQVFAADNQLLYSFGSVFSETGDAMSVAPRVHYISTCRSYSEIIDFASRYLKRLYFSSDENVEDFGKSDDFIDNSMEISMSSYYEKDPNILETYFDPRIIGSRIEDLSMSCELGLYNILDTAAKSLIITANEGTAFIAVGQVMMALTCSVEPGNFLLSINACRFWVYLQQQGRSKFLKDPVMKSVLNKCETALNFFHFTRDSCAFKSLLSAMYSVACRSLASGRLQGKYFEILKKIRSTVEKTENREIRLLFTDFCYLLSTERRLKMAFADLAENPLVSGLQMSGDESCKVSIRSFANSIDIIQSQPDICNQLYLLIRESTSRHYLDYSFAFIKSIGLAGLLANFPSLFHSILIDILPLAAIETIWKPLRNALESAAAKLSFDSYQSMIRYSMPLLLEHWTTANQNNIETFPISLFEFRNIDECLMDEFLRTNIICNLLELGNVTQTQELASRVNLPLRQFIEPAFPRMMAKFFLMYNDRNSIALGKAAKDSFFGPLYGKQLEGLVKANRHSIFGEALLSLNDSDIANFPSIVGIADNAAWLGVLPTQSLASLKPQHKSTFISQKTYSARQIFQALGQIVSTVPAENIGSFLCPAYFSSCIQRIANQMAGAALLCEKTRLLNSLFFLLLLKPSSLAHPLVLRLTVALLVPHMRDPEVCARCCFIFDFVCRANKLQKTNLLSVILQFMPAIIENIEYSTMNGRMSAGESLVISQFLQLIVDLFPDVRESVIWHFIPLPDVSEFDPIRPLIDETVNSLDELKIFHRLCAVLLERSKSARLNGRLISHIRSKIGAPSVFQYLKTEAASAILNELQEAIVAVLHRSSDESAKVCGNDSSIDADLCRLMAEIGPFCVSGTFSAEGLLDKAISMEFMGIAGADNMEHYLFEKTLRFLLDCLLADRAEIRGIALSCLHQLARTERGKSFALNNEIGQFIEPFLGYGEPISTPRKDICSKSSDFDWTATFKSADDLVTQLTLFLTSKLGESHFLFCTAALSKSFPKFAQKILPILFCYLAEVLDNSEWLLEGVNQFMARSQKQSKSSIVLFLRLLLSLRFRETGGKSSRSPTELLDWRAAAEASLAIGASAEALMFFEQEQSAGSKEPYTFERMDKPNVSLAGQMFKAVFDIDAFLGVPFESNFQSIVERMESEQEWQKTFCIEGSRCFASNMSADSAKLSMQKTLLSLGNLGQYSLIASYGSVFATNQEMQSIRLEAAWRCCAWDINDTDVGHKDSDSFFSIHQLVLESLRVASSAGNSKSLSETISKNLTQCGKTTALKKSQTSFGFLSNLIALKDIEEAVSIMPNDKWWLCKYELLCKNYEFSEIEPILAVRTSALNSFRRLRPELNEYLARHLLGVCDLARSAGNTQLFANSVSSLAELSSNFSGDKLMLELAQRCQVEEAKLLWELREPLAAIRMLKRCLESHEYSGQVQADILCLIGNWAGTTRSEAPSTVIETYFKPAIDKTAALPPKLANAFYSLAEFSNERLKLAMESDRFDEVESLHRKQMAEMDLCRRELLRAKTKQEKDELTLYKRRLERQFRFDSQERNRVLEERNLFLLKAIEGYLKALSLSDEYDVSAAFNFCSLWFANNTRTDVSQVVNEHLPDARPVVFLPLMYQLSARLSGEQSAFQQLLGSLIVRICSDYPHHSLSHLFALKYAEIETGPRRKLSIRSKRAETLNDRSQAASDILIRIQDQSMKLASIVADTEQMVKAYNELAYWQEKEENSALNSKDRARRWPLPRGSLFQSCTNMRSVQVLTTLSISAGKLDSSCVTPAVYIKRFEPYYKLVGGVNRPKLIKCYGSDGKVYQQLVKGRDDLRQDAVLQQVFTMVNTFFGRHASTRNRNLVMRTYKVVPLSSRSGVLQWVDETVPIGTWLHQAHQKYHPTDTRPMECREIMAKEAERKGWTVQSKTQILHRIRKSFHPVFRYFFFARFPNPTVWLDNRTRYTRSVAAASIVGHMLGLGDRHSFNILIDHQTAEVIHIDLGIAFNQGQLLPTPEMVPFRLTNDIVDGMGLIGVEGTFRRCCEKALKVLRTECDSLMTILEVFKHDPLYQWTLSPVAAGNKQRKQQQQPKDAAELIAITQAADLSTMGLPDVAMQESGDLSPTPKQEDEELSASTKEAERALLGVRSRLSGDQSVECRVNELINSARAPENLALMFHGWEPWL